MIELDKSDWWTGFWNDASPPEDGCLFVISKTGRQPPGPWMGCGWNDGTGPNAWVFHITDWSGYVRPFLDKLHLPNKWYDQLINRFNLNSKLHGCRYLVLGADSIGRVVSRNCPMAEAVKIYLQSKGITQ